MIKGYQIFFITCCASRVRLHLLFYVASRVGGLTAAAIVGLVIALVVIIILIVLIILIILICCLLRRRWTRHYGMEYDSCVIIMKHA